MVSPDLRPGNAAGGRGEMQRIFKEKNPNNTVFIWILEEIEGEGIKVISEVREPVTVK